MKCFVILVINAAAGIVSKRLKKSRNNARRAFNRFPTKIFCVLCALASAKNTLACTSFCHVFHCTITTIFDHNIKITQDYNVVTMTFEAIFAFVIPLFALLTSLPFQSYLYVIHASAETKNTLCLAKHNRVFI